MIRFCVLASGSQGNCSFLETPRARILVDAGLSVRDLTKRLASIGASLEQLDAILITHEHSDHVAGLMRLVRKTQRRVPVFLTRMTAAAIDWEDQQARLETFQSGATFTIGDVEVSSFGIPHDAVDPVGFCFHTEGIRIGIATDLGYVPDSICHHLRRANLLLLESNHDLEMLKVGPYPWVVKQRVMGRRGHLSNDVTCDFVRDHLNRDMAALILGHLSEHNNHPAIVRMQAEDALSKAAHPARLVIAEQHRPSEVFAF